MPVRKGAVPVKVQNSGLVVFLYDEANARVIRESRAQLLEGYGDTTLQDSRLADLAARGLLVAYELRQDDDIEAEVVVGPPLSAEELGSAPWLEPQHARIAIPSGTFCVEGYDALTVGRDEPRVRGGRVDVPKGNYLLTLYRVNWRQVEAEGTRYDGPGEIVVLTPATADLATEARSAFLPSVAAPVRQPWVGKYKIAKRSFDGSVVKCEHGVLVLNLDEDAAAQLQLEYGDALDVRCGSVKLSAVFLAGEPEAAFVEKYGKDRLARYPGAWWTPKGYDEAPCRVLAITVPPKARLRHGTRAVVSILAEPVLRIEALDREEATASGSEAVGKILDVYCLPTHTVALRTNIDARALEAAGAVAGRPLSLECAGVSCPFELFASSEERGDAAFKASRLPDAKLRSKLSELEVDYKVLLWDEQRRPTPDVAKRKAAAWKQIDKLRRTGLKTPIPACGALVPDPRLSGRLVLEVQPFRTVAIDGMHPAFDFTPERGLEVRIRRG